MNKYGAQHTEVIDFITQKDNVCALYIIQSESLTDELTLKLQEKINNYLTYALDGQLDKEYPDLRNMKLRIQIDLQHKPEGVAAEFLEKVKPHIEEEGIEFSIQVGASE